MSRAQAMAARVAAGGQHDPAEREADRFAERVTGLRPRPSGGIGPAGCAGCGNRALGRHLARGLSSPGQGLPPGLRDRIGPTLGASLDDVRLHVDSEAAASARAVGARAYTLGPDVVFAGGAYTPGTAEGQRLLAHELAHVAQAGSDPVPVLRREGDPANPAPGPTAVQEYDPCKIEVGPLTNQALVEQMAIVRNYLNPRERGQDKYYDYANLARRLGVERKRRIEMGHVWLGQDGLIAVPGNLYRLDSAPGYTMLVSPADVAGELGAPTQLVSSSIVTSEQFRHLLDVKQIPQMDFEDYFRQQQSNPQGPEPLRFVLPPPPSTPPVILDFGQLAESQLQPVPTFGLPAVTGQAWRSPLTLPTYSFGGPSGLLAPPEPAPPGDVAIVFTDEGAYLYPVTLADQGEQLGGVGGSLMVAGGHVYQSPVDISGLPSISRPVLSAGVNPANPRSVSGSRVNWRGAVFEQSQTGIQILTRSDLNRLQQSFPEWDFRQTGTGNLIQRGQSESGRWAFYEEKLQRLGGSRPATFQRAVGLVNQGFGTNMTIVMARGQSWIEVPVDQVAGVRTQFQQGLATSPADWANLTDANLRASPIKIGDRSFGSFNDLEAARVANDPLRAQVIDMLAQRLVRPGAISMAELLGQQAFREQGVGPGGQPLTEAQYRAQVGPELQESIRLGSRAAAAGTVPEPALGGLTWRSGLRGAGAGAGFAAGLEALRLLTTPGADWKSSLLNVGGGAGGGLISSSIEAPIVAGTDALLLGQTGALAGTGRIAGRFFGGGLGGAVAAPLVTAALMGLSSEHYTGIDYAAKMGRSAVAGGVAGGVGAGGAALYGAAGGTEFGPPGWVVGAIIGLIAYAVTDAVVGDEVEHDIRLSLGEYGCKPAGPDWTNVPEPAFHCFAGDTLITMADGSARGIAELRAGDLVLGCDEAGELSRARVQRLHVAPSVPCLELRLDRAGPSLKVTAAHPLLADGLWRPAGSLRPGSQLMTWSDRGAVAPVTLLERASMPAALTVFNLTVDGCHTFFAEGVLVHNKFI